MLAFKKKTVVARILLPGGAIAHRPVEIRIHPITGRTSRITFSRSEEREPGAEQLPEPPPDADGHEACPFCRLQLEKQTPRMIPELCLQGRMIRGASVLFPNLFPYGQYSAVSLFDDRHFVEIGTASPETYTDSFLNCRDYLLKILDHDPGAVYMAITQNHLPSAGGSLLHPHLQVHADHVAANRQRRLRDRAIEHRKRYGRRLLSEYLDHEKDFKERMIGNCGPWQWLAAFAPQGFFEIWGILPAVTSLRQTTEHHWRTLARGVLKAQKFYRSLGRNGYNLGLLLLEDGSDDMELRVVMKVRSNYAPWTRSDYTGYEVMLGDMATFTAPEEIALMARPFWADSG
ncbi:MAG: galactose-1-phosphate uridylyltransferase [Desulfobacteraceae bacterium]|jgi:galactose-1-phosphate uridylyltransferase